MALDKLVDSAQLDSDLASVANAIRTKGGTSTQLAFPQGFVSAVQNIQTGITPTGTKQITITANGTTTEDVAQYANAEITVNVLSEPVYSSDKYGSSYTKHFVMPDRESANATAMQSLYEGSTHMETLVVGANYLMGNAIFKDCTSLKSAKIKSCASSEMFWNCSALKYCTVYNDCGTLNRWAFDACRQLVAVILPDNALLPLGDTSAFTNSSCKVGGTGRIYVPANLVDSYKAATNWATFASNILPIEDNLSVVGDYL